MTIFDALEKDHRKVENLLDRLLERSESSDDQWKPLLDELRSEVIPHAHAEEAVFYNALRQVPQTKDLVAHSYNEHLKAEAEIRGLGAAKAIDANWTKLVQTLHDDLNHHIEEEEGKIFSAARGFFSDEEARQMGEAFERLKPEMAKDADSVLASTVDLVSNLLPKRFSGGFQKHFANRKKAA
jgi:hemerythrin superfamily protein